MSSDKPVSCIIGPTRSGKSWLANRLIRSTENPLVESDGFDPCTNQIDERAMFNDETLADTIGFLNRQTEHVNENDQKIIADLTNYLKGKTLRCLLYLTIFPGINSLDETFLHSLKAAGLQRNILIIRNRTTGQGNLKMDYKGFRTITIEPRQTDFGALKAMIRETQPLQLQNMVVPPILFKLPIMVKERKVVEEFIGEKTLSVKETLTTTRQFPVVVIKRSSNFFEKIAGVSSSHVEYRTETTCSEIMVDRVHRVYQMYQLELAERFDGVPDIYSKTALDTRIEKVAA